ncbi:patatin-like phospholipase family protein [Legionella brunensis]|uniref:Putative esterase with patatin domain protein n=1 Tax=Legionella brunensis TaxID=29422 RepID=A0A0W0SP28_9GAMM|nr:patatin-like phospholipase family protein [Legionella brunensis]KTC85060.1 putative esterase with patatin domain protein [Legionella brunensis]
MKAKGPISPTLEQLQKAQQQPIERIVCSGGGAKGVGYAGSYRAMQDTGVLKKIQAFSGASAGAITAAFMAVGMPSDIFREQLLSTNFKDLLGKRVGAVFGKNEPGISSITKDGKPLEAFIRDNIIATVKGSLQQLDNLEDIAEQHEDLRQLLAKVRGESPRITFGDLAILNRYFPEHFKQLTIPAVRFPDGKLQIFNSDLTPDVEIALACRASASIPVVLQPIEIEINGVKQRFVDGGLYDNLPTDYFDLQENGTFAKNTKPEQTMVFAFGEGLDDKKNQVFQALYGKRWDEVVSDEILNSIIDDAIVLAKQVRDEEEDLDSAEDEAQLLHQAIKYVLAQQVKHKVITIDESQSIMSATKKAIDSLLLKPKDNQEFWNAYKNETNQENRVKLLGSFVKEKMKPILYDAGVIERLKRNVLVEVLGDLHTSFKNTAQKEAGYQKLRSDYALRTVELRVGNIKTTDFDEATKLARVMDALGYLDTINYITNHELYGPDDFNEEQFYIDLVDNFEHIHRATLMGAGKDASKDPLIREIAALRTQLEYQGKPNDVISRQVYQLIKDKVERRLDSIEAFALARAVEYGNKTLTADALFKETYEEGFNRSGTFSISNITGERIFKTSTLHEALKEKSMFDLYENQPPHNKNTRTDKVFDSLAKLTTFRDAYNESQMKKEVAIVNTPVSSGINQ